MFFFIQGKDCRISAGDDVKRARMEQKYPCFLWDIYNDTRLISDRICDGSGLIEFAGDGSVLAPPCIGKNILLPGMSLEWILSEVMPDVEPELAEAS